MLKWSFLFLLLAIIAAVLGFSNTDEESIAGSAKILFFLFISIGLIMFIRGLLYVSKE